jgi:hypothetical protein
VVVKKFASGAATTAVDSGAGSLLNTCVYNVTVQTENGVGLSATASSDTTASPTQDKSAEILGNGNNSQETGNGTASNTDKFVGKQLKNDGSSFANGSIGHIIEVMGNGTGSGFPINPTTFCGPPPGLPCAGGEVLVTKLTSDQPGRYIIEIDMAKGVALGTGQKVVVFDPTPDDASNGDTIFGVPDCPKKGTPPNSMKACIVKLVAQPANNPAVLLQISVLGSINDPATGLRR